MESWALFPCCNDMKAMQLPHISKLSSRTTLHPLFSQNVGVVTKKRDGAFANRNQGRPTCAQVYVRKTS